MARLWLVAIGLALVGFGAVGWRSAEEIVQKQYEEGMAAFTDSGLDLATRVRVTRWMAALCVAVGATLVVVGVAF